MCPSYCFYCNNAITNPHILHMNLHLFQIAVVVDDYDRAIDYYTIVLKFELLEDTQRSETKRWVIVRPGGANSCSLLLAKAVNDEQESRIGNQTGGRVFFFLHVDDFDSYFNHLVTHQVHIVRGPSDEDFGRVAVFRDLYGNLWDLIQPIV